MDREISGANVGVLRSSSGDAIDWSVGDFTEPLTIYCSSEAAPHIREMLYNSYVNEYCCPPEIAREYVYGPPPPEPERPDPSLVALAFEVNLSREAFRRMGHSLAESVAVIGHVGSGCNIAVREISQLLIEEQNRMQQTFLEEMACKTSYDILTELGMLSVRLRIADQPQPRRSKKKKRGHNADRDRVIGGKAGYC